MNYIETVPSQEPQTIKSDIDFSSIIEHCHISTSLERLSLILKVLKIPLKIQEPVLLDIKSGFFGVSRKDGSHYVDHLIKTLLYTKKYDNSFDDVSALIAVLHDSIEDTAETFESLQSKYGHKVALGVDILSKKPFWEYIPSWDQESFLWTQEAQDFSLLKTRIENYIGKKIDHDFKFSNHSNIPSGLRKRWEEYEEKYEEIRDNQYFGKFKDFTHLKKYIQEQAEIRGVTLSAEELEELSYKITVIKLSDRRHNIETLPRKKRKYKIQETIEHLRDIAKEVAPSIWDKISQKIQEYINQETQEGVSAAL